MPTPERGSVSTRSPPSFKIIAGSYEKLLYGLEAHLTTTDNDDTSFRIDLTPIFIFSAHVSCIKAVAASPTGGKWLATGSTDEVVKVWDLRRRKEVGGLMHHQGSITHLHFPTRSHLLSASEDGTLCLFRARDWVVLRVLKGHKGRVNCVAVHPSGKVAISVGKDRTLRMWDLMRGKGSASTKLGKEGETVRWSTDGSMFAVQTLATVDIYTTNMNIVHTISHPSRIHDIKFSKFVNGDGEILLVGAEDKKVTVYDVSNEPNTVPIVIAEMVGHTNRIKAVDTITIQIPPSLSPALNQRKSGTFACTASSDGRIHLYDMSSIAPLSSASQQRMELEPIGEYDTKGTRLTCMTLAETAIVAVDGSGTNGKRKRVDDGDDGDRTSKRLAEKAKAVEELLEEDEGEGSESSGEET